MNFGVLRFVGPSQLRITKKSKNLASDFGTKDSSDSKSHDFGIDSIEKPGMSFGVLRFVG